MFSCMSYAKEDRDVATEDIPVDLLKTDDTIGITHLKFDGMMAELLSRIDTDLCRNYTTTDEKGCNVMYAECLKALYVTLDAALLFWLKLSTNL